MVARDLLVTLRGTRVGTRARGIDPRVVYPREYPLCRSVRSTSRSTARPRRPRSSRTHPRRCCATPSCSPRSPSRPPGSPCPVACCRAPPQRQQRRPGPRQHASSATPLSAAERRRARPARSLPLRGPPRRPPTRPSRPRCPPTTGPAITRHENIADQDPRDIARALLPQFGFSSDQFSCLDSLWVGESGWRVDADNPTSSAYGIPQALPGDKMASAGPDWETNPATQIKWGLGYIARPLRLAVWRAEPSSPATAGTDPRFRLDPPRSEAGRGVSDGVLQEATKTVTCPAYSRGPSKYGSRHSTSSCSVSR